MKKDTSEREILELATSFNSITPEQFLSDMYGGNVSVFYEGLLERIRRKFEFEDQVINVLLYYVIFKLYDNKKRVKFPMSMTMKISEHWKSLGIETSLEAIKLAKQNHKIYIEMDNMEIEKTKFDFEFIVKSAIKSGIDNEKLGELVKNLLS